MKNLCKTYCYVITCPEAVLRVLKKEGWLKSAKHENYILTLSCCKRAGGGYVAHVKKE